MGKLKSAKEILEEIGFKKDSIASTQEALYRFLTKETPSASIVSLPTKSEAPQQLEFDFEDHSLKSRPQDPKVKKVSHR